jgi:predicted phage-related endonuclease
MRYVINKPEHGSQDWLTARWKDSDNRARISASVAGAVHGENPFTSAADLAFELLAAQPPEPKEPTQAMERGNRLEPLIMKWAADLEHIDLNTPDQMYCYDDGRANLIATLDALDSNGIPYEIKTSTRRWDGVLPRYWYWQGVQQSICTGADVIEWVIFDSAMQIHRHTQYVTSDEQQIHIQACAQFLTHIHNGELPPDAIPEYKHAEMWYPESISNSVELPDESTVVLAWLHEVREQKRELEKKEDELKASIALLLGEADTGKIHGVPVITWRTNTRSSIDTKQLQLDHPALCEKYKKETSYRVMKLTPAKGDKQ